VAFFNSRIPVRVDQGRGPSDLMRSGHPRSSSTGSLK
jgi:hypothetical protein